MPACACMRMGATLHGSGPAAAQDAAEEPGRHAYLVGSCKTSAGLVGMMAGLKWEVGNGSLR